MALILSIETSSKVCSVNLSSKGETINTINSNTDFSHAEVLTIQIQNLLQNSKHNYLDLDAIAISEGPGSYTGLRIGTSVAKGICYAHNIPLINIATLQAIAYSGTLVYPNLQVMAIIDARRQEIYTALFTNLLEQIKPTTSLIINEESQLLDFSNNKKTLLIGNGLDKLNTLIVNSQFTVFREFEFSAQNLAKLAYKKFLERDFADLSYFEPVYLKLFDKLIN